MRIAALAKPVRGAYLDMNPSERTALVSAAAGVGKGIATAGLLGLLGLTLLAAGAAGHTSSSYGKSRKKGGFNLSGLCSVQTPNRDFLGFCIDSIIEFSCEGNRLRVSTDRIRSITSEYIPDSPYYGYRCTLVLIDGSEYQGITLHRPLSFWTAAGIQRVLPDHAHWQYTIESCPQHECKRPFLIQKKTKRLYGDIRSIQGASQDETQELVGFLKSWANHHHHEIITAVGEEAFQTFFGEQAFQRLKAAPTAVLQRLLPKTDALVINRNLAPVQYGRGYGVVSVRIHGEPVGSKIYTVSGLDITQGLTIGRHEKNDIELPYQNDILVGKLVFFDAVERLPGADRRFKESLTFLQITEGCCVRKNGLPVSGTIPLDADPILIGERYELFCNEPPRHDMFRESA